MASSLAVSVHESRDSLEPVRGQWHTVTACFPLDSARLHPHPRSGEPLVRPADPKPDCHTSPGLPGRDAGRDG